MLSTRIRGQIIPTRNLELQKINMRCGTTSQYETGGKNYAHLLSHNLPDREKIHWSKHYVSCTRMAGYCPQQIYTTVKPISSMFLFHP